MDNKDIKNIKVGDFLDYLTDINYHTERCIVEAIISERDDLIDRACLVRLRHSLEGCLTTNNEQERRDIYRQLETEGVC